MQEVTVAEQVALVIAERVVAVVTEEILVVIEVAVEKEEVRVVTEVVAKVEENAHSNVSVKCRAKEVAAHQVVDVNAIHGKMISHLKVQAAIVKKKNQHPIVQPERISINRVGNIFLDGVVN